MCGICGQVKFKGDEAAAGCVEKMTGALRRRGPDAQGIFFQGPVGLGHRRLKIIDLSERAQQPMVDNQLGLSIIFNAAVYNYAALRRSLETKGCRFFSTGDTEAILKAFHAWGQDCVQRLTACSPSPFTSATVAVFFCFGPRPPGHQAALLPREPR